MVYISLFLLIVMTIFGSIASYFLKKASADISFPGIFLNKNIYIGAFLYLLAALINIFVLRYLDYSVVLPLTSLTYVWTMIISYNLLGEKVGKRKIFGIGLILLGTIVIAFL